MEKQEFNNLFKDILLLPDNIITDEIFSFYNPYKKYYDYTIIELQRKYLFKACMRQLRSYCVYNRNRDFISFQRGYILSEI
jgi:hypothetical protein